ncbi:MAG: FGGY-family carbohydrate kinase [Planctomycetota bacterium]|jgi:xylulokinase|nr:FGGY-family carbohydrate kinase [Planctomycetota bacterium]
MLIGIDIGTGGTKAVVFDKKGRLLGQGFKEYGVLTPAPAWAEQWPDVWLDGTVSTLKDAFQASGLKPGDIHAVAISGLYGGSGIPIDKDKNPIRPCMIWMDRRARKETQWVKDNVPLKKIFGITGNYVDSYFGFTKMMWLRNNEPENWKRVYQFSTPKDYIIYRLTGELATDYSSAGNIGGVFDIRKKTWSPEMCKILGIPQAYLPERITRSHDVVGKLNKEIADLTGLRAGTPIVAGGIDAPVAQFSCGVVTPGEHVAMVGTSICWGTVSNGANLTPGLISYPYVVNDDTQIYTFGGGATSGAIVRWFRDEFGQTEKEFGAKSGIDPYALIEMEMKAKKVGPGAGGLVVLPYFMGERSPIWDPDARGTIIGLNLLHSKAHIFRAFMEGVAQSLRHNMEAATEAGIVLDKSCFMVGGAAKSDIWSQIFADVTGYHIRRLALDVEAPFGDAFLAGMATGVFKKGEEIKKWLSFREENRCNLQNHKLYSKYYDLYKRLYQQTKGIMAEIAAL